MKFPKLIVKIMLGVIAIFISAFAYFMGSGVVDHFGYFMWIAPMPIFIYALYQDKISGFIVVFLGFTLGQIIQLVYLDQWLPPFLKNYYPILAFMQGEVINGFIFTIFILLTCWTVKKIKKWYSMLLFPAAWTVYEYFISIFSAIGSNSSLAYTQIHWISLIQITSITGIWGITFLISLLPISLVVGGYYFHQNIKKQAYLTILFSLIVMSGVLIFGFIRLHLTNDLNKITVGLIALPENVHDLKTTQEQEVLKTIRGYTLLIDQAASQGAQFILLPEKIVTLTSAYENKVYNELAKASKKNHVYLIVGFNQISEKRNLAVIFSPQGKIITKYSKMKLIQFGSEKYYIAGKQLGIFHFKQYPFGVAICHDFDFQRIARKYSKKGARVLFLPALDFVADGWLHGRIAIMRGVEGNYAMIRAAQWGLLSISNAKGQIINLKASSLNKPVVIVNSVSLGEGHSMYSYLGDWFPWVLLILFGILFSPKISFS